MHALTLDFRRDGHSRWLGPALLLMGVAAAAVLGLQYRQVATESAQLDARLHAQGPVARKKVYAPVAGGDVQRVALELKQARDVAQQLAMPWDELFRSVEAADAPTVALLGIESTADRQRIQISAEAKNLDGMLRYVKDLEGRSLFADVYLHSHQIQQQDPQHPVRFVLSATWLVRK